MIFNDEKHAPTQKIEGAEARLLKVLLSPAMNEGLTEIAVGYSIVPPGSTSDRIGHVEGELFYVISGEGCLSDCYSMGSAAQGASDHQRQ